MKNTTSKKIQLFLWFAIALAFGIIIGLGQSGTNFPFGQNKLLGLLAGNNNKVNNILDLVKDKYVDAVDVDSMEGLAVNQILGSLDPHTVYLPPDDARHQNENLEGNFDGIGIEYFLLKDTIFVTDVRPYGPAEKAGLKRGDKIVAVNNQYFKQNSLSSDSVVNKLRGKKGSEVSVTLLRNGILMPNISITRDKILLSSIDAAYLLNRNTGYIKIANFGANTEEDFVQELQKMESMGIKNLVLDLRGNGGGYLEAATALADQFLPKGKLIVYTKGLHEPRTDYSATENGLFESGKVVLLVDEGTASASEIVAGALQDWDRATIIGRRSFGKGLVQQQFMFNDGSAMNLTVARYYTPSGRSIQKSYKNGINEYKDELKRRFKKGEITSLDSNLSDTSLFSPKLKFKTAAGKAVYAGGGIMPNIFIPLDTTKRSAFYETIVGESLTANFVYAKLIQQVQASKYKSVTDFIDNYQITDKQYQQFLAYCNSFKVKAPDNETQKSKPIILRNLKSILVKYYYGDEGYYRYTNTDDDFVKAALQKIQNP